MGPSGGDVQGEISFEDSSAAFEDATVHLRLEDVRVVDAAARVVSWIALPHVSAPPPGGRIPFVLPAGAAAPGERYNVRVHVDVDGDGEVGVGDFVTFQSHPVVVGDHVSVVVRRV